MSKNKNLPSSPCTENTVKTKFKIPPLETTKRVPVKVQYNSSETDNEANKVQYNSAEFDNEANKDYSKNSAENFKWRGFFKQNPRAGVGDNRPSRK